MPTIPSPPAPSEPHLAREVAESFGADPDRYHRTRPRYPRALVRAVMAGSPGGEIFDVGIGTGISADPFRAAGCRVLGVEVDPRMAESARHRGFDVEVARFEDWDAAGRRFDAIIAGTIWHWIDPTAGATKAARLLRPEGRLAVFWNVGQPPTELARAFSEVYRRVLPGTPFGAMPSDPLAAYEPLFAQVSEQIKRVGAFNEPERWRFDFEQRYTKDQWLEQVPTFGGHSRFPPGKLDELLAGLGDVIDAIGDGFTVQYATITITAARRSDPAAAVHCR